jgi:hypothetical protein
MADRLHLTEDEEDIVRTLVRMSLKTEFRVRGGCCSDKPGGFIVSRIIPLIPKTPVT